MCIGGKNQNKPHYQTKGDLNIHEQQKGDRVIVLMIGINDHADNQ